MKFCFDVHIKGVFVHSLYIRRSKASTYCFEAELRITLHVMKQIPLFFLTLLCNLALAQRPLAGRALHFQTIHARDTIDFIVADTVLNQKKPIFLFCQGSLPMPLFAQFKDYGAIMLGGGIDNFDLSAIRKQYHLVLISMPKTPLVATEDHLNENFQFIPDKSKPNAFLKAYIEADYLENYVQRGLAVLKFLKKQPWADNRQLVVAGHSQGAKVATKIAAKNKQVSHLGLFGANPFGRVDQFIRQAKQQAREGAISWEQANAEIEKQYAYYRICQQTDSLQFYPERRSLQSFSEPFLDDWLALKIPIYLAYGTEDDVAALCDLVPIFFIQENKNNLTHKRYLRLEHNFFEVEQGKTNYDKAHWREVMNTFIEWTLLEKR